MIKRFGCRLFQAIIAGYCLTVCSMPMAQPPMGQFPAFQPSDAEIKSLLNYLDNLDEVELAELEELSKKMLSEMGFDPETLQPVMPGQQPKPPAAPSKKPAQPKISVPTLPKAPAIAQSTLEMVQNVIPQLIKNLTNIRQKATGGTSTERRLRPWLDDISDLIYYLKVIAKDQHYKRLASDEYTGLRQALKKFNDALITYEPHIIISASMPDSWEDPYDIVGVLPSATHDEIEQAFMEKKNRFDPKILKEGFEKTGLKGKELQKALKEAEHTFAFITDAYDKIKTPELRAVVDRERAALLISHEETNQTTQMALEALANALSMAIYQDQILNGIETFLKKYEPTEYATRTAMLAAQEARKLETEEYAKLRETELKKRQYIKMPSIRKPESGRDFYDYPRYGGGGYPYGGMGGYPGPRFGDRGGMPYGPGAGGQDKDKKSDGGGKKQPSGKQQPKPEKKDDEKSGKDEKKPEKPKEPKKPEKKKEASAFDPFMSAVAQLDQQLFGFNQNFDPEFFTQIETMTEPEKLVPALQEFRMVTDVDQIGKKLEYIAANLTDAKDSRKKEQYTTVLKGVKDNLKDFKRHVGTAQESLEKTKKRLSAQAPESATSIVGQTNALLKNISDSLAALEKATAEEKKPALPFMPQPIIKT